MSIEKIKKMIPESERTQDIEQWFDTVEQSKNEVIEDGLIVTFDDIMRHPFDEDIWKRWIHGLSFSIMQKPYRYQVLGFINMIQSLTFRMTDKLDAPAAVSLIDPKSMIKSKIPKISRHPYLLLNPTDLFIMLISQEKENFHDVELLADRVIGILIHEAYHILRGDLLIDVKYHYKSRQLNDAYKEKMKTTPVVFKTRKNSDGESKKTFPVSNIYRLNNILMDMSINQDIYENIHPRLMPENAHDEIVTKASTQGYFENILNYPNDIDEDHEDINTVKSPDTFNIHTLDDFYSEDIPVQFKQNALLEYHMAKKDDADQDKKPKNNSIGNGSGDNQGDGEGDGGSDTFDKDDLLEKHAKGVAEGDEEDVESAAFDIDNMIQNANQNAEDESGGKAYAIAPSHGLREKIIEIKKAKALPRFDFKVQGLIKDYNRQKKLNYRLRHIAFQKRLDMCRFDKSHIEGGVHVYMDTSGSVTDEIINAVFNVLRETVKHESVLLYVFANGISSEPLEIQRSTSKEEIIRFLNNADVGFGTEFTPVFKNIAKYPNQKHAIFSDYFFNEHELTPYIQKHALDKTPIIHIFETKSSQSMIMHEKSIMGQFIKQNQKYNKMLVLSDYTL